MSEDRAEREEPANRRAALTVVAGAALVLTFYWLSREQLFFRDVAQHGRPAVTFAVCFAAVALSAVVPRAQSRNVLLGMSVLGCIVQLGLQSAVIFGFAAAVIAVSRLKLPVFPRVILVLVLWLAPIVPKFWLPYDDYVKLLLLYLCWAGFPFAAIYLVVERARGALAKSSWLDDALYMVALPRFVTPFYQPISPAKFLESRVSLSWRLALRGLALGLYGAALHVVVIKMRPLFPGEPLHPGGPPRWLRLPYNLSVIYAINAANIFCAVGLFRVLGFDLSSGFRWPLASRSMAEFFRRWNSYIYEAVMSLFFFPFAARLRQWLPDAVAAVVAGYAAIFLGSFCLNWFLVPASIAVNPLIGFGPTLHHKPTLAIYMLYWGAIIVPQIIKRRFAAAPMPLPRWRRALQHVLFIATFLLLGFIARHLGVTMI